MDQTKPSAVRFFFQLFQISATCLGGGAVMIGLLHGEALRRHWAPQDKLDDMLTLSLSCPGPMATAMSWQMGYYIGGLPFAALGVCAVALPPFLIFLFFANWLFAHMGSGLTLAFFKGAGASLVALMGLIIFGLSGKSLIGYKNILIFAGCATALILFKISPIIVLILGTLISLIFTKGERS